MYVYVGFQLKMGHLLFKYFGVGFTLKFGGLLVSFKGDVAISVCYYKKSFIDLDFFGKNSNNFKCHRAVLIRSLEKNLILCKI